MFDPFEPSCMAMQERTPIEDADMAGTDIQSFAKMSYFEAK